MSSSLTKKSKIKVIDVTLAGKTFNYLRPEGRIIFKKYFGFCFEIKTDGWYTGTFHL